MKISRWIIENSFKILNNKTKCMHFCQIHKMHNQLALILNGTELTITYLKKIFKGINMSDIKAKFSI